MLKPVSFRQQTTEIHSYFRVTANNYYLSYHTAAHTYPLKVRCSDLLSSSAVRGNCRASDIMQIYPRRIYYYKEQGYDSQ